LMAGVNAALKLKNEQPLILDRSQAYIGVLIDDLVTRGVDEPYRLFTSRSEFRLTVRQDNALRRLAPIGMTLGIYDEEECTIVARRLAAEDEARHLAESTSIRPEQAAGVLASAGSAPLAHSVRIAEVARRQDVPLHELFRATGVGAELPHDAVVSTELELKYAGYFERERVQAEKLRRMGAFGLDQALPYGEMRSLSVEARQKLAALRPRTLAHAASVPGVSPTDLQNLVIEIEKRRRK
jgi:tRNA uridine 5-carboxymethylaminomethyl modification enzyme